MRTRINIPSIYRQFIAEKPPREYYREYQVEVEIFKGDPYDDEEELENEEHLFDLWAETSDHAILIVQGILDENMLEEWEDYEIMGVGVPPVSS